MQNYPLSVFPVPKNGLFTQMGTGDVPILLGLFFFTQQISWGQQTNKCKRLNYRMIRIYFYGIFNKHVLFVTETKEEADLKSPGDELDIDIQGGSGERLLSGGGVSSNGIGTSGSGHVNQGGESPMGTASTQDTPLSGGPIITPDAEETLHLLLRRLQEKREDGRRPQDLTVSALILIHTDYFIYQGPKIFLLNIGESFLTLGYSNFSWGLSRYGNSAT